MYPFILWTFLLTLKHNEMQCKIQNTSKTILKKNGKINMENSFNTVHCSNFYWFSLECVEIGCTVKTSPQNYNFLSWHPRLMLFKRDQQRPFNLQMLPEQAISSTMDSTLMTPFMRFNQRHLRNVSSHCQVLLGQVDKSSMPVFDRCQIQNTAFVSTSKKSVCILLG